METAMEHRSVSGGELGLNVGGVLEGGGSTDLMH